VTATLPVGAKVKVESSEVFVSGDDLNSGVKQGKLRRRDFLGTGALAGAGLLCGDRLYGAKAGDDASCILLMLVGGPSQIDTWDMKPDAPAEIRGPFRPIRTNVPGVRISEIFPRMARHADKFAILRAVHHDASPVHDAGYQLLQTGRLFQDGMEYPHIGCAVTWLKGQRGGAAGHVLLPGRIGSTGGNMANGQSAGFLGPEHEPLIPGDDSDFRVRGALNIRHETDETQRRYGLNRFGRDCLRARRLVEAGVRFVTVNMFDTVFDETTWDIHGYKPFSCFADYRDVVGPMFDMAYSSLLSDLEDRGLLSRTMVVAAGEFGRTPRINPAGGRDHWPQCQSVLMAGCGIVGGQVIGSSDAVGAEPKDRPVSPAEIVATIGERMGVSGAVELRHREGVVRLLPHDTELIRELFA
jgi:hypothetical protein